MTVLEHLLISISSFSSWGQHSHSEVERMECMTEFWPMDCEGGMHATSILTLPHLTCQPEAQGVVEDAEASGAGGPLQRRIWVPEGLQEAESSPTPC